ncbi:AAA family ATPase [Clostridium estertheticum]|uniref:Endonuclease GajA/Old nuclease/RecF-like AAA domain-containing protein n=1 Tax=Clostridium estertheticum subsp. estertheticum TaxID=1552 RepID=A0A1J0GJC9_9CLOT|nr:AAA family ATPase [Clostridium estertheticum]APC41040.1 hypothetical protein A7L45_13625 [Clostridium estertheticum subsp. estertheticum]
MKILYVDNYRNFTKAFIPLKQVNFLVGENSTGKTSILSLIYLLKSAHFEYSFDFRLDEINVRFFDEIVTKGKKSFTVGILNEIIKKGDRDQDQLVVKEESVDQESTLFTFINIEGIPTIKSIHILKDNIDMEITFYNNSLKYKYSKITEKNIDINFLRKWADNYYLQGKRSYITNELEGIDRNGLFFIVRKIKQDINRRISETKKNKGEVFDFDYLTHSSKSVEWIGPIRAKAKYIYDSYSSLNRRNDRSELMPYFLKKILSKNNADKWSEPAIIESINRFGKESGLFDSLEIKSYSRGKISPFEVNICFNNKSYKIANVGYGVSQILPIIVSALNDEYELQIIQQPEVHLHPRAQAAFGEFIYNMWSENRTFIVETHSDFIIDRFRICTKMHNKNNDSQVLFFERTDAGNNVYNIDIDENGNYSDNQPDAFRDFFITEEINLLGI